MSLRKEQCKKVCRILDDVLANRPTERDSLIVAVQLAFEALTESHWIPVTERLPEKLDYYLVSGNNSVWFARYESGRFLGVLSGHALDTVIAWMPLPEPYKGVTNGRD